MSFRLFRCIVDEEIPNIEKKRHTHIHTKMHLDIRNKLDKKADFQVKLLSYSR